MTDSPDYHFVCFLPGQILVDGCKQLPVRMQAEGSFSLGFFQIVKDKLEEGLIGADLSLMALVLE